MSVTATDFFCGMGGSSTGLAHAGFDVKLAANHWDRAIETHSANHTDTEHLLGDIQAVDLRYLPRTDVLWASPICTELSPAGGRRRKGTQADLFEEHGHVPNAAFERTRVTFCEVVRAAEIHRYKIVLIENVVEAAAWELFDAWLAAMTTLGYEHQFVSVSAAHIGGEGNPYAPQWRDRLYIIFHRKGMRAPNVAPRPLAWCFRCDANVHAQQWWKRPGRKIGKYGQQYIYVCPEGAHGQVEPWTAPAISAIDLSDPGTRIGDRKRVLAAPTMRRIEHAVTMLERGDFGPEIIMSVNHGGSDGRPFDPHTRPLPTETIRQGEALLVAAAGNTYDAASRGEDGYVRAWPAGGTPTPAQTTTSQLGLVTMLRANGRPHSLHDPLCTFSTGRNHGLIIKSQGGKLTDSQAIRTTAEPLPTTRAASADFLVIPYRKGATPHLPDRPISAQTTKQNHGLLRASIAVEDCYFRMLKPRESANAQAFPRDYIIHGNLGEQQRQAGNAVPVNVSAWLGAASVAVLDERSAT